ncbi:MULTISPECIES: PLP-dependent aminotransferase family protein [unclassified Acinetobacter]|uniref:aminotransferase-like domain-containing protein n=1 Tax=unclassified Acinetobacter TaxID=196816 RepID=UPI002576F944|nr:MULTISPECIES: PLP-dependent aminotransferase family protein [unclassified Acinetobacter]MDM1757124.1 PLP-dependent aminotransferase family protein [Acinetobacter sp. 256-1]MDM1760093.1 PLP-dependent aminotransferase family protein [Acinetobacter sp. 251-1]
MYKADQLAQHLRQLIENGTLKPNEKLPSLRDQVQRSGFSLMTVMNAYQALEAQGLIYSKAKSGYFVNDYLNEKSQNSQTIVSINHQIEINSLIFKYLKSIQPSTNLGLGSAFPSSELVYSQKLTQIMGQLSRAKQSYLHVDSFPPGNIELRNIIAQRYSLHGIATQADDLVITSGCLDALNLALAAVTQAGDYIVLQETIFYGAWQAAERLGLKVITVPEHPRLGIDLDAFEHILKNYPIKVCWLMLNSHNPIGFTANNETKQKIAELLHQYQVYLIEDDVYEELYFGQKKPLSVKHFDQHNWVLHCSSFSKTLGANFRVGWVHAGKFSNKIQHLQLMSTISTNSLLQNALVEFLQHHHYEKHLRQLRRNLERNKKQMFHYLEKNLPEQCQIFSYASGFFLWIKLPIFVNSMDIYHDLIQQNIDVTPSQLFNMLSSQQHYLRLNCSFTWTTDIQHGLDCLIERIQDKIQ